MVMDPLNNELQDSAGKLWDDAAKTEWRERVQKRYHELNTSFNGLDVLIELDGRLVGYGDIFEFASREASVGIVLNKEARGKGIGKAGIQVLTQLGFELGMHISLGTMKANAPMRGIMKSLGIEEEEKIIEIPGRGVVAEVEYTIERAQWADIDIKVEFGESG
jgi:RimJ/RimL family protein N-acetyltransferase